MHAVQDSAASKPERLLTKKEACHKLGQITDKTLERYQRVGILPEGIAVMICGRRGYVESRLDEWILAGCPAANAAGQS